MIAQVGGKILLKVAENFIRRLELSALIVKEAGKTMNEALADVDEAIDFFIFTPESNNVYEKSKAFQGVFWQL